MIKGVTILLFFLGFINLGNAQFYCKGKVIDANTKKALGSIKITVTNSNTRNNTDAYGSFGVMANKNDTLYFEAEGYEKQIILPQLDFTTVLLKPIEGYSKMAQQKYTTLTKDYKATNTGLFSVGGETYYNITENQPLKTQLFPTTSFTLNTNKSSYSNIRRFINSQQIIPSDVIRIEEILNYFNLMYGEKPTDNEMFSLHAIISDCPWNSAKKLLNMQIVSKEIEIKKRKPNKITMLLDCSGSMDNEKRLPIIQSAFKMLQKQMLPTDTISLITFGTNVNVWFENVNGTLGYIIIPIVDSLEANGDTPGELALLTAYNSALKHYNPKSNNRIILCTDGDFNVGATEEEELGKIVSRYKESGIYLTCLGLGKGNFKNSKLENLAKKGNGNLAYIDSEAEAEKLLVKESLQTLVSIADNVSMKLNFDKEKIANYRLIGFDNILNPEMEQINELDGGTIGSGHIINIVFEIEPTKPISAFEKIASATLHYNLNNESKKNSKQFEVTPQTNFSDSLAQKVRFNNGLAGLGLVFRNSPFKNDWNLMIAKKYFMTNPIDNHYLQTDIMQLIEKAIKFYPKKMRGRKTAKLK